MVESRDSDDRAGAAKAGEAEFDGHRPMATSDEARHEPAPALEGEDIVAGDDGSVSIEGVDQVPVGVIEHMVHRERCRPRVHEVARCLPPVPIDGACDRNIGEPTCP